MYFRIDTAGTSNNEVSEEPSKEDSSKFKYIWLKNVLISIVFKLTFFISIKC